MVRSAGRRCGAAVALLLAGCQCSFDSATLDDLACTTAADCAPDQDCIEGACAQRRCSEATDCGPGFSFVCEDPGFCVAAGCATPEDCGPGLVCEDGYCRADAGRDAGEADAGPADASVPDASVPDASVPDASVPDASMPDASMPDASVPDASVPDASVPDASLGCVVDGDCDDVVFCNGAESCAAGACQAGAPPCPPGGPCTDVLCDEGLGACRVDPHPDGSLCDDGDACSRADACAGGACAAVAYSCGDAFACTDDMCDGLGGCSNPLQPGFCGIGGACRSAGEADPGDGCRICDPATDTAQWTVDCGACVTACGALEQCQGARCAPAPFGTGADGDLAVAFGDTVTIGAARTAADGVAGTRSLDLADATAFAPGQVVLVHQSQGGGAGTWELARIASLAGNVASLAQALQHDYSSAGGDRAQAVAVPQYRSVTVDGTLTAPGWDGASGGILTLAASGLVTVGGAVNMTGGGFRGSGHGCIYQCATGFAGESADGQGPVQQEANGAGGGAGTAGQDCGMGGGGGYGSDGGPGGDGINLFCGCGLAPIGGAGGAAAGTPDLDTGILFGGAGGEGGGDEDGARPGPGGDGGGLVVILASTITVTGVIAASGTTGGDGDSVDCAAGGCGMGGRGGGAGGGIRILAATADLGDRLVRSLGGDSGLCTCGGATLSGVGAVGRIHVSATVLAGVTDPP
jgi:hypothetical protein